MLNKEKTVWIYWKPNKSAYALANAEVLDDAPRRLGSSITAVGKMVANSLEQKTLMPSIIGISANSPDWDRALSNYWNSISEEIPAGGKKLDLSFSYDINDPSKTEFIEGINKNISNESGKLKSDEDLINYIDKRLKDVEIEFKRKIESLKTIDNEKQRDEVYNQAYKVKYDSIFKIEADRFKVGTPNSPFDYLLYKYCLVYSQVANTNELINKSTNIRFYLHSEEDVKQYKEAERKNNRNRISVYSKAISDITKVENIIYALGKGNEMPDDDNDKLLLLEELSKENTVKFIAAADDSNLKTHALIEKYISFGILKRIEGTSIIVDATDASVTIGNDLEEAIKKFSAANNASIIKKYEDRYKGLPK